MKGIPVMCLAVIFKLDKLPHWNRNILIILFSINERTRVLDVILTLEYLP